MRLATTPDGHDDGPGTLHRPFATLARARDAVREPVAAGLDADITVLIRDGCDQTLTVDPANLRFIFQGMLDKDKSGKGYGQFQWRIGMLMPVEGRQRRE